MKRSVISKFNNTELDFTPFLGNSEDDDATLFLKSKFWTRLNDAERNLFAVYADFDGNTNKLAEFFHISWPTASVYIKNIRNKILC